MAGNTLMSLLVKLGVSTSELEKGLDKAEGAAKKSAGNIQQSMLNMADGFDKAGNALTVGLTLPIVAFAGASVKAAMDAESAMAELNAVIKSTGGVAKVSAKDVTDFATAMQKVTKFDDEAIISGQSMLLTFTKIGKDVFPRAATSMLNMAEKFGSIETASIQLGKALNDPVAGVSALRRVGVMLSAQQEKQVKDFMAVNNIAAAQGVILKELETEFGGLAIAAGDTTAGKFAQLKNALGDFQEAIGAGLIPTILPLVQGLTDMFNSLAAMPPGVQGVIIAFFGLLAAIGPLLKGLSLVVTVASAFAPGGVFATVAATTAGAGTAAATASVGFGALAVAIGAVLLPILAVAAAAFLLYAAFTTNFMGITDTLYMLVSTFEKAWGEGGILGILKLVGTYIKTAFLMQFQNLQKVIGYIAGFIANYFIWALRNLFTIINWVIAAVKNLGNAFSNLKLPKWLMPGSPTPLEIGLRGIGNAAKSLSLPTMSAGLKLEPIGGLPSIGAKVPGGGAGGTVVNLYIGEDKTLSQASGSISRNGQGILNALNAAIGA